MFFRNVRKFLPTYTALHPTQDCSINTLRRTKKRCEISPPAMFWSLLLPRVPLTPNVAVCRSLEEFCSLLSVILQWHAKLQDHEGQGFFVEPECKPITS